jgi:hypothetical protein
MSLHLFLFLKLFKDTTYFWPSTAPQVMRRYFLKLFKDTTYFWPSTAPRVMRRYSDLISLYSFEIAWNPPRDPAKIPMHTIAIRAACSHLVTEIVPNSL